MTNELPPIWHQGELAVQQRAGTDKLMSEIGGKFIREFMPQQHRDFFEALSMIFIGYVDDFSDITASVFFGEQGFIESPTETELIINTQVGLNNFMKDGFVLGDRIGLLGIEFNSKRRNRLNGVITDINQKSIKIKVLQSFGNCPKYIQDKTLATNPHYGNFSTSSDLKLNDNDLNVINNADTFFIASGFNDGQQLNNRGADISHRGGEVGFVTINSTGQLMIEDYRGNGFFNTLGNLVKNPTANLLFFDWKKGHALQITVSSKIHWSDDDSIGDKHNIQYETLSNEGAVSVEKSTPVNRKLYFTVIKVNRLMNALAYCQSI